MADRPSALSFDASSQIELIERAALLGNWWYEAATGRITWSEPILRISGLERAPTLTDALAMFPGEGGARIAAAFDQARLEGEPYDVEVPFRVASGDRIWARVAGEAVRDPEGRIVGVQGVLQDISSTRAARSALAQGRERLRELADAMPLMVWSAGPDGRVDHANERLAQYLGADAVEALRRLRTDAIHPDDRRRFAVAWGRAQRAGEPFAREIRVRRAADGMYRWHRAGAVPVRDARGRVRTWFGTAVDIHDLRTSEERARALSGRLQATLTSITDALLIIDREWRFTYLNPQAERLVRRPAAELLGRVIWEEFPDAVGSAFEAGYRQAARTGVRTSFEAYYPPPLDAWFAITAYPSDEGLAVYFQDVTEHRRARERLQEEEERFRAVTRSVTDVVWEWDMVLDRRSWGEGLPRVFGHRPEDLGDSRAWLERIHPDDRARVAATLDSSVERRTDWHSTYRFLRADGQHATVEDHGVILPAAEDEPVRMVGGMNDITRRLALEQQLRRSQRLEAVGQLVGGVAHDFNNLLTVIMGNTELLIDEIPAGDPRREPAELTHLAASRGAELTHRLLAFARRQALDPQALDVAVALRRVRALLGRTLREDVALEVRVAPGTAAAFVDPAQFEAALLNLAINAQDAMPGGGRLVIEAGDILVGPDGAGHPADLPPGTYVSVAVADTGTGIAAQHRELVFEPFFTTKEVGRGTGLGLSMVYGFARQSGGDVALESEPGAGTRITLFLPSAPREAVPRAEPAAGSVATGHETILVVEDDDMMRRVVARQLTGLGYKVIPTAAGDEALAALDHHPEIALLFTDIVLAGGMNGRELADRVAERRPELPVLFTSGYTEDAVVHFGGADVGVELIAKPYRRAELARRIREVLDR